MKFDSIRLSLSFFAWILLVALISVPLRAQSGLDGGQISGQVLDPSKAAVANTEVTARNVDTNFVRTTMTDSAGRYAIGPVPLGTYEVSVKPSGMAEAKQQVYVSLGGRSAANFEVGMQPVQESLTVVAESPTGIQPEQTFSKSILTEAQLRNLPAPGRRPKNLFLLTPGTEIEPECGGFSISGQKGVYTSFNVDGGDYTSSHLCGHVEMSPVVTIEALQEFQVLRSTFSAEFGRSTGGIINLATKSGTNHFHGTGFYLFRNKALSFTDPYNREQINLGNQFGGSIGGPIVKDRTFFFTAVEAQDNSKPVKVQYSVLDQLGLRNTAGAQALIATAPENGFTASSKFVSIVNRVDHHLTDNNSLEARADFTRSSVTDVVGSFINTIGLGADSITNRDVENASPTSNRTNATGMLQLTSVLSPRRTNELRAEYAYEYRPWDPGNGPEVTVRDGSPLQTIGIYGPQATGLSYGNVGYRFTDRRTQFVDNYSFVGGAHTVKIGIDTDLVHSNVVFNPGSNGIYTFNSLADFLNRNPFQYSQFAGTGAIGTNKNQVAFYIQDEWRVRPGLTVSPGFRYEMAFLPNYQPATASGRWSLATTIPDDKEMFGPRLGIAWDVRNDAKTVVRAATGLFYAPPYISLWEEAIASNGGNPDLSSNVNLGGAAVANAFQQFGVNLATASLSSLPSFTTAQLNQLSAPGSRLGSNGTVFGFDPNFKLPRSLQFRVAVEQQVAHGITASIDYTQIGTTRMDRVRNLNLLPPVPDATGRPIYINLLNPNPASNAALRPFPQYAATYLIESSARSFYQAMAATINIQRKYYTLNGAYTLGYSKSYDDHENGGFTAANYVDAYNLNNEWGWSNIDQRHQFTANGVFFLPKGFEFSATARFNSGRPFSPKTGVDSNNDGIVNDRPVLNGSVVPRNTFRNTGFADTSARIQKNFELPNEKGKISVSAEFFNIFNAANVEIGSAQMTYGPNLAVPSTNPLFGKVKDANGNYIVGATLRTTPFQAQLGLRFEF